MYQSHRINRTSLVQSPSVTAVAEKKGQTALSTANLLRDVKGLRAGTESVPFFSAAAAAASEIGGIAVFLHASC